MSFGLSPNVHEGIHKSGWTNRSAPVIYPFLPANAPRILKQQELKIATENRSENLHNIEIFCEHFTILIIDNWRNLQKEEGKNRKMTFPSAHRKPYINSRAAIIRGSWYGVGRWWKRTDKGVHEMDIGQGRFRVHVHRGLRGHRASFIFLTFAMSLFGCVFTAPICESL